MANDDKLELQKLRSFAAQVKNYIDTHSGDGTKVLSLDNTFTGLDNFIGGLQKNGNDVVIMPNVIQVGTEATEALSINGLLLTPVAPDLKLSSEGQSVDDATSNNTCPICLNNI